jgi:hypothetical protein
LHASFQRFMGEGERLTERRNASKRRRRRRRYRRKSRWRLLLFCH